MLCDCTHCSVPVGSSILDSCALSNRTLASSHWFPSSPSPCIAAVIELKTFDCRSSLEGRGQRKSIYHVRNTKSRYGDSH